MNISIFLAQFLGLYLVIVSISMLVNAPLFKTIVADLAKSPALLMLNGFFALFLGVILVVLHNLWVMDWRVVITLLIWLTLFKGVMYVLFPKYAVQFNAKFMDFKYAYQITVILTLLVGLFLCYQGFFRYL